MLLSQILNADGSISVVAREGSEAAVVRGAVSTYALASEALAKGIGLAEVIAARGLGEAVDLVALAASGRLALPITHPDLTHMHLTGTGLTHLGSAATRDAMHAKLGGAETLTDSMKMFQMGLADAVHKGGSDRCGRGCPGRAYSEPAQAAPAVQGPWRL